MTKKIVLGTLLIGLIGILVAGAIIRTIDKTENVAEARGLRNGRSEVEASEYAAVQAQGRGGYGQGGGYGRPAESTERQVPNYDTAPDDWIVYEGTVLRAAEAGEELVTLTDDGQEVTVGTGPGYLEAQGLVLQAGERVQVQGYLEDGEFKAGQVTRLRDGETITLRDQYGRPAWAGGGRWATDDQAGRTDAPGGGTGTGQAEVDEWIPVRGTVVSVDDSVMVVQTGEGEITIENRPWWFAQEQGFAAQVGDEVTMIGFYEEGEFEVGQIDNLSTVQTVSIREETGRPLWAGRGRRGGQ